jgi:protein-ribulosamine 3-kinase
MNPGPAFKDKIEQCLKRDLGQSIIVEGYRSCGGGCINQSGIFHCGAQSFFLKYKHDAPDNFFEMEAEGLRVLAATDTVRIPKVYTVEKKGEDHPAFLVIEALEQGPSKAGSAERFGHDLAAMHRHSHEQFGFEANNFIGLTPQINDFRASWSEFFRDCRLKPQFEWISQENSTPSKLLRDFDRLLGRLEVLFDGPREKPALLHGDLWGGNSLPLRDGSTAIFDPAVYFGHREAELAMTELFGKLPSDFYQAYNDSYPLSPGYEQRRDLYNLYHMLNHWNLFGDSYRRSCERIIHRYI